MPNNMIDLRAMPLHTQEYIAKDLTVPRVPYGWIYMHFEQVEKMGVLVYKLSHTTYVKDAGT